MELVVLMLIDLSPNNLHQLNVIVNHVPIASDKAFKHKDKNLNDQVEDTTVNAPLFVKTHLQRSIFLVSFEFNSFNDYQQFNTLL